MNHFLQPVFPEQNVAPFITGGIAKNDFAFMNLFFHHFPTREQPGAKP
jgi:hypothetical protein